MSDRANGELIAGRSWWRPSRVALIAASVVLVLLAGGVASISYAGYKYSEKYRGKILPGVTIAGVDVSGMGRKDALRAVRAAVRPDLTRTVTVEWQGRSWKVTPKELGARNDARSAVRDAFEESSDTSFVEKTRMRLFGEELSLTREIAIRYPKREAEGFVQGIAAGLDRDVVDSSLEYSTGWVEITPSRAGRKVDVERSAAALHRALRKGTSSTNLTVEKMQPEVTENAYDEVLLVRIGENKLYLYENGEISHSWTVATGQPEYPTPTGLYEITEKRYLPTWINPAPDTWGKELPAEIPPGPENPLGLRALNWSAEAIRFHGTSATYSLGYNASHGCVRMANAEVIQLYDMIDVGTPIVSVVAGPLKPLYVSSPDPTPVAEEGADAGTQEAAEKSKGDKPDGSNGGGN